VLRAYAAVKRQEPQARIVLVGDGPLARQIAADCPDAIRAGVQYGETLAAHYASADLFLFASLSETFGNVTLEALASGLPVVAYDCGAASAYMPRGRAGLRIPPGDEEAFVAGACTLAGARERWPVLRAEARACALHADWGDVLRAFERRLTQEIHARQNRLRGLALAP